MRYRASALKEMSLVSALVLTHSRPKLAEASVNMLLLAEGIPPENVFLVVNGVGEPTKQTLTAGINIVRLPKNIGPAGGFKEGLKQLISRTSSDWFYLCEDDICLLSLPTPRVTETLKALTSWEKLNQHRPVGAVVAYGRVLDEASGRTLPHTFADCGSRFEPIDVAAWGATLVHRDVVERMAVLPDAALFFGYEDFDFFYRVKKAGFQLVSDRLAEEAVGEGATDIGRRKLFAGVRPSDNEEVWRFYYAARNFIELARRHGKRRWILSHCVLSFRRWQLAGFSSNVAKAIVAGLIDGFRGTLGRNDRWQRSDGEYTP